MALVKLPENRVEEYFQKFIDTSAFTFEGIDLSDKKGLKELEKVMRQTGYTEKHFLGYWFKGEDMNRVYGLTESNAYPNDLTFLVIPEYNNAVVKMGVGARWFDDIVCNNNIKQNAITGGTKPDYDYYEE